MKITPSGRRTPRKAAQFWGQFDPAGVPRMIARLKATIGVPCLLCDAPSTQPACFQPNRPEAWGGRPDTIRLFIYGLCVACSRLPDVTMCVEARLMAGLIGQGH